MTQLLPQREMKMKRVLHHRDTRQLPQSGCAVQCDM